MKIQCDVCSKDEASVFCAADEAVLCHGCDRTIHHANKLAGKHTRFSLHHPLSKDSPLCDICQERRAFLFCQDDRAILCRECDFSIHRANEHSQKHNRFLLTGAKLSATSLDQASSSSNVTTDNRVTTSSEVRTSRSKVNRPKSISKENVSSAYKVEENIGSDTGSLSASSISEYFIETIPGYCFEDLLDASFAPNGYCKNYDHHSAFQDQDLELNVCLFPLAAWAPQAQVQVQVQSPQLSTSNVPLPQIDYLVGVEELPKANAAKRNWKWRDNGCTVPEIGTPLVKKCRR